MHQCVLQEGQTGRCRARVCRDGKIVPAGYGQITGMMLDPIEKKPLRKFCPGTKILSVGSFGCNLNCFFCQNHEISMAGEGDCETMFLSPEELCEKALACRDRGNIGVAFTYNEPTIAYEYVRDTAKLVQKAGMKTVMVTNGSCSEKVLDEILPYIDAMNIDLKCYSEEKYEQLGGSLDQVKRFIRRANEKAHVELTYLLVPEFNDSESEFVQMCQWIRSLSPSIVLHVTRFFPFYHSKYRYPTPVDLMYRYIGLAQNSLEYVYSGNL